MAYDEDLATRIRELIASLEPWAMQSVAFARALPPKETM